MKLKAADVLRAMDSDQLEFFLAAAEQRGLFYRIGDELYAAVPNGAGGWWVYELSYSSAEYGVDKALETCTCPAPKPCKHLLALRHGGDIAAPWRPGDRRRRKR